MFYVLDEHGNKIEAYDKQGVLAMLEQAIEDGDLTSIASDSAFVDKLKCCVGGGTHKIAFVTQAKYNELVEQGQIINNAYYFVIDDMSLHDIDEAIDTINAAINSIDSQIITINSRLDALGFSEGVTTYTSNINTPMVNTLKKQGKYCIFNFAATSNVAAGETATITIPSAFVPKIDISMYSVISYSNGLGTYKTLTATTGGTIVIENTGVSAINIIQIKNVGWETE